MCIRQRIEGSNPSLTAIFKERACTQVRAFLFLYRSDPGGMRSLDQGSTTGAARGTVCEPRELTARRVRPNGPNQSLPHRHIQRKSLFASTGFFVFISLRPGRDEKPRPGFDHWRSQGDSLRATRADCPQGEAQRAESIPPSPPYSKKEPVRKYGLFCFYIAPGKRQVRSAYLPYKTCRRVGKRKRTHLPAAKKPQR